MGSLIIFHIIFHAFSKALIFIYSRVIIHSHNLIQDLRILLSFEKYTQNLIFLIRVISRSLSLIRVIRFICFFSKDLIIFNSLEKNLSFFMSIIFLVSCIMTIIYSFFILKLFLI